MYIFKLLRFKEFKVILDLVFLEGLLDILFIGEYLLMNLFKEKL